MDRVRVDKWLWAARFAKTRSAATDLVLAGHVKVGGERVKPARRSQPGDTLEIRPRNDPPRPRRHRTGRPPRAGEGCRDALRGDARIARGAGAARARAPAGTAARRRPRGATDEAGAPPARRAAAGTAPAVKWVALLRGVNLGARNKVPMAQLRTLLEDAGYGNVRTYIASGNVLLDGPAARKKPRPGSGASRRRHLRRDDRGDPAQAARARCDRRGAPVRPHSGHPRRVPRQRGRPRARPSGSSPSPPKPFCGRRALPPAAARRAWISPLERADRVAARRPGHTPELAHGRRAGRARCPGVGSRPYPTTGRTRWHWQES